MYRPQKDLLKKGKYDLYGVLKYTMFPEMEYNPDTGMEGEFNKAEYPEDKRFLIEGEEIETGVFQYDYEIDLPYGKYDLKIEYDYNTKKKAEGKEDEHQPDYKDIPEDEKDFLVIKHEPNPMSLEDMRQLHAQEEEENKKREQEARLAQKRLEEEKARLRYEQQQQIAKQEQNTAQLKVYFEAMNLGFHTGEEDFNASMSVLSIYH